MHLPRTNILRNQREHNDTHIQGFCYINEASFTTENKRALGTKFDFMFVSMYQPAKSTTMLCNAKVTTNHKNLNSIQE